MALFTRHSHRTERQPVRPAIESLESRAYFSLLVTIPGPLPTAEIAGVTVNQKIAVNVANNGTASVKGPFNVAVFVSTSPTYGTDDSEVIEHSFGGSIGQGRNRTFKLNVKAFPVNLNGDYYVLSEVSTGNGGGEIGVSTTTIAIAPKEIDLSDFVQTVPATGRIGHLLPVTVDVTNNGNVIAQGNLFVNFGESVSTTGSSPVNLGTLSKRIHIKPTATQVLHFMVPLPLGIPSGNQFIVADVDPGDVYNESNLTNQVAVSGSPVSLT